MNESIKEKRRSCSVDLRSLIGEGNYRHVARSDLQRCNEIILHGTVGTCNDVSIAATTK